MMNHHLGVESNPRPAVPLSCGAGADNADDREADLAKILAKLDDQSSYESTLSAPETALGGARDHADGRNMQRACH